MTPRLEVKGYTARKRLRTTDLEIRICSNNYNVSLVLFNINGCGIYIQIIDQ